MKIYLGVYKFMCKDLTIRLETRQDYKDIVSIILNSDKGLHNYNAIKKIALIEEIRNSKYYIPDLSFVAEYKKKLVGHFMFSHFPLSRTPFGKRIYNNDILLLAPVSVHPDFSFDKIAFEMLSQGIQYAKQYDFKGIIVESNMNFYYELGFHNGEDCNIIKPLDFWNTERPPVLCQEISRGSLKKVHGYVLYDMYYSI